MNFYLGMWVSPMKLAALDKSATLLAGLALWVAVPCEATLAAPPLQISVSGTSRGYTNTQIRDLITRGVAAALTDDRAASTRWYFSIQSAPGNHPRTQIVATMRSGDAREVSGFFTSPTLGTSPSSLFVGEIHDFAERLLQRPNT
jgi:hypothetical protein